MFEDQSQKIYETIIDKANGVFVKKPLLATSIISGLVSLGVLLIVLDYRKQDVRVELSQDSSVAIAAESASKEVTVDLGGAVKTPGVYTLDAGSRLTDLLALGGGFVNDASSLWVSKNLNLAQNLVDGEKVYIPFEWDLDGVGGAGGNPEPLSLGVTQTSEQASLAARALIHMGVGDGGSGATVESSSSVSAGSGTTFSSTQNKINVNTSSASDLDLLPGVGPAFAGRIVENRPYTSFEEFKEKSGLSTSLADSLKELVFF